MQQQYSNTELTFELNILRMILVLYRADFHNLLRDEQAHLDNPSLFFYFCFYPSGLVICGSEVKKHESLLFLNFFDVYFDAIVLFPFILLLFVLLRIITNPAYLPTSFSSGFLMYVAIIARYQRQVVGVVKIQCGHKLPAYTSFPVVGVSHYPADHNGEKEPDMTHHCLPLV